MPWAAAAQAGTGIIGGVIAKNAQEDARKEAKAAFDASVRDYEAMGIPTIEAQQMVSEKYRSAGLMTPELEEAVTLGQTNLDSISLDPKYKEAQLKALDELQGISDGGGYNLSDRAGLEKTLGSINSDERGAREAIIADARSKGQMGGGSELVAQLLNQQDASTKAHSAGLSMAGEAQKRALDAILQKGNLAGSIRTQDYSEQAKAKEAQDAIAKWNAANTQSVRGANIDRGNTAQNYNLTNNQRIMDANTDVSNSDQRYNKGLYQTQFENQLNVNTAKANARAGQATNTLKAGDAAAKTAVGIGQGVGQVIGAYGQNQASKTDDEKKKTYEME